MDAILVASGANSPVLLAPSLHSARAEAGTGSHPLVIVDASMPRNADPRCGSLPAVTIWTWTTCIPGAALAQEAARMAAVPDAEGVGGEPHLGLPPLEIRGGCPGGR